jgi:uncharacterized protein YcfJ
MKIASKLCVVALIALSGCAGNALRTTGTVVGATSGAVAGALVGKGKPAAVATGSGLGGLLGGFAASRNAEAAFAEGYEKGRSDSVKERYKAQVDAQRAVIGDEAATLFDVPLPERVVDGAILKPGTQTLRIQD